MLNRREMNMSTQQTIDTLQVSEYEKKYAEIVTKAWEDEEFKQRLFAEPKAVLTEYNLEVAETFNIKVVENTENLLNINFPAKSSLGNSDKQLELLSQYNLPVSQQTDSGKKYAQIVAKAWDDASFKQRLLSEPKMVFQENGINIPDELEIRVLENTVDSVYFILPIKPSEELSDEQLETVTGGVFIVIPLGYAVAFAAGVYVGSKLQ